MLNQAREDRIYELQQALAELPPESWGTYLTAQCPEDEAMRAEVLARQAGLSDSGEADEPNVAFNVNREPVSASQALPSVLSDAAWLDSLGYDLLNEVGRGGMGVVYRVRDRKRRQTVALKTLQEYGPASLVRFKQEFRALAEVTHPNLAALHDVVSDGTRWCFTMEFVNAVDFLTFVREGVTAGKPVSPARLRFALRQLVVGLTALHAAGILHRDVKPNNVLVTPDGRVVLVDFGLAAALKPAGMHRTHRSQVAGTLAYMSPEQAAGQPLTPATDWYAVGVVLFEALTGQLPFDGDLFHLLDRKMREDGPSPQTDGVQVPEDLGALCTRLLRRNPEERAGASDALACLAEGSTAVPPERAPVPVPLVGRERQLRDLTEAFDLVRGGQPAVALVAGRSGVGKTSLVEHFLAAIDSRLQPVVLSGRCYEQAAVPYKVLDTAMDALARYLAQLPHHEAQTLLPRDVGPLSKVFPVFLSVGAFAGAPAFSTVQEPQELRRRASAGLRELLARLGDRRPVIIAVDDLQWGDVDSAALLRDLLRGPDPPLILFVGAYRIEDEEHSAFLRALADDADTALSGVHVRRIEVLPLTGAEVHELVHRLSKDDAPSQTLAEDVARESGGNPFFVTELLRYVQSRGEGGRLDAAAGGIELDDVILTRVRRLPGRQQRLLETLAACTGPLDEAIAIDAAVTGGDGWVELRALRSARLVKTAAHGSRVGVEPYHDRIREAVRRSLPPGELASRHFSIIHALEAAGGADPETLALHAHGAGEHRAAARYYELAGDRAAAILAFDRAGRFYQLALQLAPANADADAALHTHLGDALANAGRGGDAARAYLRAADTHPPHELELRGRAAMQLLISGHVDEGLAAVRTVLAAVGVRFPSTARHALLSLLLRRARLRLRGLGFEERSADRVPPNMLHRVDVSWSIAIGLSLVDPIRGAGFQALNLRLALEAGEPCRLARAVTMEAAHVSTGGSRTVHRTNQLLRLADGIAARAGDRHSLGMLPLGRAITAYLQTRWRDAVPDFAKAQACFRNECIGAAWELATAQILEVCALCFLGDVPTLNERLREVLREAEERENLYVLTTLRTLVTPFVRIVNDEPSVARAELDATLSAWSTHGFHVQHSNGIYRQAELELYVGNPDAAAFCVERLWKAMRMSHLMRVQFLRVNTGHLRIRTVLAQAAASSRPEAFLKLAARGAAALERDALAFSTPAVRLVRAAIAARRGDETTAADLLRQAIGEFEQIGTLLYAAAARRRLGTLVGGSEGKTLVQHADARFAALMGRDPGRLTTMLAPGFPD